jgi:hypothetical protein
MLVPAQLAGKFKPEAIMKSHISSELVSTCGSLCETRIPHSWRTSSILGELEPDSEVCLLVEILVQAARLGRRKYI